MPTQPPKSQTPQSKSDSPPRIIGGSLRGRKLIYTGDPRTRPMKDRAREGLFNLLADAVKGKHAVDLFAGTGALGLEAISRGAAGATLVERHFPTADILRQNAAALGVEAQCTILPANTLLWPQRWPQLPATPWLVFCSPPYDFYIQHTDEMLALVNGLIERALPLSIFCLEADTRFDFATLPQAHQWNVHTYPPAVIGIWEKITSSTPPQQP
ncbi:MAG TPA: RsmD family RNA methyltransferase [Pirellulales bacterium]|nr:RsmD family RNA methyltransferase [Pirellulales bacterium]